MPYTTPLQLATWPGLTELAQSATPAHARAVSVDLLRATIQSASRADWPADQQAVADETLAVINAACNAASAEIDGYLAMRHKLPLSPEPPVLSVWAAKLARYYLHRDLRLATPGSDTGQHPIHADYESTLKLLRAVADGKLSLGIDDPAPPAPEGVGITYVEGEARHWSRDERRGAM